MLQLFSFQGLSPLSLFYLLDRKEKSCGETSANLVLPFGYDVTVGVCRAEGDVWSWTRDGKGTEGEKYFV